MKKYVLGFAFDTNIRVAMIKKDRPEWMAGRWNGIGGKLETGDTNIHAGMSREFEEETGLRLDPDLWQHFATLRDLTEGYEIYCFVTILEPKVLDLVHTVESEEVCVFGGDVLVRGDIELMRNLRWLIPMSLSLTDNEIPVEIEYPLHTKERE